MMWVIILLPLVLFLLPLVLFFVVSYTIASRRISGKAAIKWLPIMLLISTIFMVFIYRLGVAVGMSSVRQPLLAERIDYTLSGCLLVLVLALWLYLGRCIRGVAQAGDVLVDLGRLRYGLLIGTAGCGCALFVAVLSIELMLSSSEANMGSQIPILLNAICMITVGTGALFAALNKWSIRSKGIVVFGEAIRWDKIKRITWKKDKPSTLALDVERLLPWWPTLLVPVPPEKRGAVTEILKRHLPARPEGPDKTGEPAD